MHRKKDKKKIFNPKKIFTKFSVLSVLLSGLLSFLIYPTVINGFYVPQLDILAWVFLVPLIIAIQRGFEKDQLPYSFKSKFILTFVSGLIGHYGILFSLVTAMKDFGGLNFFASLTALTALVVIMSLAFALTLSLACWIHDKTHLPLFVLIPVFMVMRDVILHYFPFGGYPFVIPPYSQGSWLGYFQWIDVTGVFGLGFLIYLINGLVGGGIMAWLKNKTLQKQTIIPFVSVLGLFILSFVLSEVSQNNYDQQKTNLGEMRIALIQANVAQDIKWDRDNAKKIVEKHLELTTESINQGAQLVFWPETSYPFGFWDHKLKTSKFLNLNDLKVPIIFGTLILKKEDGKNKQYNAVIHADTSANLVSAYRKIHLVPFGEYLPFEKYLGFMSSLTQGVGHFNSGTEYTLLNVNNIKFGSLICIEDVFPRYAQQFSKLGADILVNYTNDAWYGDSSTQHHHVVYSQLRALENRRPVLRATNTGITAIIDPTGQVVDKLPPFEEKYLLHNLKIENGNSFYTKYGHPWVYGIYLIAFGCLLLALINQKKVVINQDHK